MPTENGTAFRLGHLEGQVSHLDGEVGNLKQIAIRNEERIKRLDDNIAAIRKAEERREDRETAAIRFRVMTTVAIVTAILGAAAIIQQGI